MRKFKVFSAIVFAIFLFTGCATMQQQAYTPSNVEQSLVILHTNDHHGHNGPSNILIISYDYFDPFTDLDPLFHPDIRQKIELLQPPTYCMVLFHDYHFFLAEN